MLRALSNCKNVKLIKLIDRIDNLWEIDITDKFARVYCKESQLLLDECLIGVDHELEQELQSRIDKILGV